MGRKVNNQQGFIVKICCQIQTPITRSQLGLLWIMMVFTQGQFWPLGIVACICVCVCVLVC